MLAQLKFSAYNLKANNQPRLEKNTSKSNLRNTCLGTYTGSGRFGLKRFVPVKTQNIFGYHSFGYFRLFLQEKYSNTQNIQKYSNLKNTHYIRNTQNTYSYRPKRLCELVCLVRVFGGLG